MSCIIDQGYALDCFGTGGVKKVWIGNWTEDTQFEYDADDVITGITSGATAYVVEQDAEYAGLEQVINISRENGSVFFDANLSLKFTNLDKDLRNFINTIAKAPTFAVIESNEGIFYYCGVESSGRPTEGTASVGVNLGDLNGATLTINWKSPSGIFVMDGSLVGTDIPVV